MNKLLVTLEALFTYCSWYKNFPDTIISSFWHWPRVDNDSLHSRGLKSLPSEPHSFLACSTFRKNRNTGTPEHPKNPEHPPENPEYPQKTRNTPQKTRNTPQKIRNIFQNTKKSAKSLKPDRASMLQNKFFLRGTHMKLWVLKNVRFKCQISMGVPGFLGGVPGFLAGVPGFLGVPGCSGVLVFLGVLHSSFLAPATQAMILWTHSPVGYKHTRIYTLLLKNKTKCIKDITYNLLLYGGAEKSNMNSTDSAWLNLVKRA